MITKFCIVCLCITASSMLGLVYTKGRKSRVIYFESCTKLTDRLISDISFKKENLLTILSDFAKEDKSELKKQIESLCKSPYGKFTVEGKLLKEDEKHLIEDFFNSLGGTDSYTQIIELENYKTRFFDMFREESEKFKKNGNVVLKLSILLGLAIGILIL